MIVGPVKARKGSGTAILFGPGRFFRRWTSHGATGRALKSRESKKTGSGV